MENRTEKYASNQLPSRSARNARLYREVYGRYDDLDNLPIEDNTDEIDMNTLQEIIRGNNSKQETRVSLYDDNYEIPKKKIDEKRVYDINKMLEKAKYENKKIKQTAPIPKIDTSILSTLENHEVSIDEITRTDELLIPEKENEKIDDTDNNHHEENLSMREEHKIKNLREKSDSNPLIENVMEDNELSLDLFENLRPTENTIITKPIKDIESMPLTGDSSHQEKVDVHSQNTQDIDIIREETKNLKVVKDINPESEEEPDVDNDFFTSSYEFSESDFFDEPKNSGIFKIILLLLTIIIFAGVLAYFVVTYGLGT